MIHDYKLLNTQSLNPHTHYFHPERQDALVMLDSPALAVFTDFTVRPPEVTQPEFRVSEALEQMRVTKVKSLLVINPQEEIVGLVSSKDLQGVKTGRAAQEHSIPASDVTVSMVMTPAHHLETIDYKELSNARVGHIARLIREHNLQHVLVVQYDNPDQPKVRGVFSASRIARQLGDELTASRYLNTVSEMNRKL